MDKLARLMAPDPRFIEPRLLAERHESLTGQLALDIMQRLHDVLADDAGTVHFQLNFGIDTQGISCILGDFSVVLQVYCQRCLKPLTVQVNRKISIGIVAGKEEADNLPGRYEPLQLISDNLSLVRFIEDEILLGMPMAPVHELDQCPSSRLIEKLKPARKNPFTVLKEVKLKNIKS